MPGRDYQVLTFDLSTGQPPRADQLTAKNIFVADMPDAANGEAFIALDGGEAIPVRRGDRFTVCDDNNLVKSITVTSSPLSGSLILLITSGDIVPLASGGSAAPASLARLLDLTWLPHQPVAAGQPFIVDGLAGSALFPLLWTVEGNAPKMNARGHKCGDLRPGGGTSGVLSAISFAWQRKLIEPGAGGAQLFHQLAARTVSYRVGCALFCESTNAKTIGSGLQIAQGRGTQENLSGNTAGLGIVPDTNAGATSWWRFIARAVDGGPLTIDQPLPRPLAGTRNGWGHFGIELVDANPLTGQDGRVNVYQGGIPVFSSSNMNLFPPASDGVDSTGFDVRVVDQGADADRVFFSHFHQAIDAAIGGDE